jgi:RNA polymerase sigma factor (sigma-70 family)
VTRAGREDVWREHTPHVLAALLRRSGDFASCEDAVQEALVAAARQWPTDGVPDDPRAWLIRVASRRLIDDLRSREARTRRELRDGTHATADSELAPAASEPQPDAGDDTLRMLVLCAQPALSDSSQVALMLRAVAGLTTAQIAAGFLVPEATMAQRISRAKATVRSAAQIHPPTFDDLADRLHAVRHALYLTFTAGHTTTSGDRLVDVDLGCEAIRLTEQLHRALPDDTETTGLLALMLLTQARVAARTDHRGDLVPLDQQDRARWDRGLIARGTRLVEGALPVGPIGPFQIQAAIAAVHAEAAAAPDTDWLQITALYRMLERLAPSPTVSLNLAVAIGMAHGPEAGIAALGPLLDRDDQQRNHRVHAAHAHLLERNGDLAAARHAYRLAASLTASIPEQRYLNRRADARRSENRASDQTS